MKRDWMTGLVLLAVAVVLAAAVPNSRADDAWPYAEDVAAESLTENPAAEDDALYGDAYEEDADDWTNYTAEGYDYDEAYSASYDAAGEEADRGWGTSCDWLAECFGSLGQRATALFERWCQDPASPSLELAQRMTSATLLPALPWLAEAGWLQASAGDPLADQPVEPIIDPYDGSPEQLTDVSGDSWTDEENSTEEEADSDSTPVVVEAVAADSVAPPALLPIHVESSWRNRAWAIGWRSEMEPLQ